MSRAAVYSMLSTDAQLDTLGLAAVYAFQAVDTPGSKPFVVIRWEETRPGVVLARGPHRLTIWVYDSPADYARIDSIVTRVKDVLLAAVHVAGSDGHTITQIDWAGDSQDLYDDVYECIVRTVSFDVVTRPSQ